MIKEKEICPKSHFPYKANDDGSCSGLVERGGIVGPCFVSDCFAVEKLQEKGKREIGVNLKNEEEL